MIWAGVNGYADDVPVEGIREFERRLLEFIRSSHGGILESIRNEKEITESTENLLHSALEEFVKTFQGGRPASSSTASGRGEEKAAGAAAGV